MLGWQRKDDENLKYLTNEEKNALLFFEETIDAFEDDIEEPQLSSNTSLGYSPRSTDDSHSESEDIIDLVQLQHSHGEDASLDSGIGSGTDDRKPTHNYPVMSTSLPMTVPVSSVETSTGAYSPDLPGENRKFHGAIPTPVIIAQKISEKNADNGNISPLSPKESNPVDLKKSVGTSPISEGHFIFPASTNTNVSRFPTNINIKPVGKQYNKTIAKAAVNVQERKAQVLANLNGPLFAEEIDGKAHREQGCRRMASFRDAGNEQTRYEALTKLGLVKETPVQAEIQDTGVNVSPISNGNHSPKFFFPGSHRKLSGERDTISSVLMNEPSPFVASGKTVVFKGELPPSEKNKRHSTPQNFPEQKQQVFHQEVKRSYSLPRPTGFRPQGITVQFSGRDSSEESRKEALRRLGLLKELSGH
ncbi:proline and serine-rich protein 2 isoform X2 [Spea bombifrons]|uniref:proline and serine-rich protein 2 isoform X2 n=1 Tax=Spea bombifrons TaxID=233779 RepID=UPI00234AD51B|nr:proline and serine-rich protein 2 isoform X2 [Spea bombifrons]